MRNPPRVTDLPRVRCQDAHCPADVRESPSSNESCSKLQHSHAKLRLLTLRPQAGMCSSKLMECRSVGGWIHRGLSLTRGLRSGRWWLFNLNVHYRKVVPFPPPRLQALQFDASQNAENASSLEGQPHPQVTNSHSGVSTKHVPKDEAQTCLRAQVVGRPNLRPCLRFASTLPLHSHRLQLSVHKRAP